MTNGERRSALVLEAIDRLPADLRACVHEFGWAIVNAFLGQGIRSPRTIRFLVKEIWAGARQPTQRSGAYATLDWLLVQAGANISAATLQRILGEYSLAIVPVSPTRKMLNASMAEVSGFNARVTKEEKHRRRLRAAIQAAVDDAIRPQMKA